MTEKCGLFTGGTTGKRDGTLVSIGGAAPLTFAVLNTVITCHVRAIDDATGLDPGEDSVGNISLIPRVGESISANNSTWTAGDGTTPFDLGVKAIGGNQPVYLKQTAAATGALRIGSLSWTAGTRVGQVGTVSVGTVGDQSIPLTWADISMSSQGFYEIWRTTANDTTTNMTLVGTVADGSTGYTNNVANGNAPTNGTAYWYHVRAVDSRGVGAFQSNTATGTAASSAVTIVLRCTRNAQRRLTPSYYAGGTTNAYTGNYTCDAGKYDGADYNYGVGLGFTVQSNGSTAIPNLTGKTVTAASLISTVNNNAAVSTGANGTLNGYLSVEKAANPAVFSTDTGSTGKADFDNRVRTTAKLAVSTNGNVTSATLSGQGLIDALNELIAAYPPNNSPIHLFLEDKAGASSGFFEMQSAHVTLSITYQ